MVNPEYDYNFHMILHKSFNPKLQDIVYTAVTIWFKANTNLCMLFEKLIHIYLYHEDSYIKLINILWQQVK